jgi:hypothetical protein
MSICSAQDADIPALSSKLIETFAQVSESPTSSSKPSRLQLLVKDVVTTVGLPTPCHSLRAAFRLLRHRFSVFHFPSNIRNGWSRREWKGYSRIWLLRGESPHTYFRGKSVRSSFSAPSTPARPLQVAPEPVGTGMELAGSTWQRQIQKLVSMCLSQRRTS